MQLLSLFTSLPIYAMSVPTLALFHFWPHRSGHMDFFQDLAVTHKNAMNVLHVVIDYECASVHWDKFLGLELLG